MSAIGTTRGSTRRRSRLARTEAPVRRLVTETKASFKTTEFFVSSSPSSAS